MSDRKLFTRRQILSVFGGATGLAIVGVEGQETSTNGNLLGGTSNMAQAYKVGEGTYKGPLSVRSDVPQEDGITFIQTDAGSNNDMFAIQHYNGGWSEQGLDLPSVNTEDLSTESHVAEYVLKTNGSTIDAIPQQNPEVAEMDELTGQDDIGPLLHEIIVNQLPPQGSKKEARGIIRPRPGLYPGDLSNAPGGAVILPATTHIISDIQSNNRTGTTQGTAIPTEYGGVTFETTGGAFRNPNVDNDLATYVMVRGIRLNGDEGVGVAFDGGGSNTWDFLFLERVMTRRFDSPIKNGTTEDAPSILRECHFDNFTGRLDIEDRMKMRGGIANPMVGAGILLRGDARAIGAELRADGESRPVVRATGQSRVESCTIRKDANGNDDSGNGLQLEGNARASNCVIEDRGGKDFANPIRLDGDVTAEGCFVQGTPLRAVYYDNDAIDADVRDLRTANDITLANIGSPTRPRWEGVVGGGPLGGVDLSTVTGQFEGDRAIGDGTSSSANAGDKATWDSSVPEWRVFQPATTV